MLQERELCAFLGVCVGDAAGAVLEFFPRTIQKRDVENALTMPGGGIFQVGRGQPTDDTELTLALFHALLKHSPEDPFPLRDIAVEYVRWMNQSQPFDFGRTTNMAFRDDISEEEDVVARVKANAEKYSLASQANGALMRVIPIAIWYRHLDYETIAEYAKEDARLSHPNVICQECNAVYAMTAAFLLKHPKDSNGALTMAEKYIRRSCSDTVQEWFYDALRENFGNVVDCTKNIGHVKHAFQLTFHFLFYNVSFEEALSRTLQEGGDTDTNAAIVCGMMGAYHGRIPAHLLHEVLSFDCLSEGRIRPVEYSVRRMVKKLNGS